MSVLDDPGVGPLQAARGTPGPASWRQADDTGKEGTVANTRKKRQQGQGNAPLIGLATLIVKLLIEIFTN